MVGDWWMVRSRPAMVRSIEVADELTKPRFWEGMGWEKRRKDSGGAVGVSEVGGGEEDENEGEE